MKCKFSKRKNVFNLEVNVEDYVIPHVTPFEYLESLIQNDEEIEGD